MVSDDRSLQILGIAVAFIVLYTFSTGLRMYTRAKVLGNAFGPDDVCMIVSYFLFLGYATAQLVGVHHGTGKKRYLIDDANAQIALQSWFLCYIFYVLSSCALKLSIGLFLLRIAANRTHILIIKLIIVANVVFSIPYLLVITLQCRPVSFWWDLNPSHHGKCLSPHVMVIMGYIVSVLNSLADWTYGILPFFMVKDLQMARNTKILVCSILGFAALGSTATIVRTPFVNALAHYKGEFLWATSDIAIWTTIELGVGATAANIATLRPLLSKLRKYIRGGVDSSMGSRAFPTYESRPSYPMKTRTHTREHRQDAEALVEMDEFQGAGAGKGKTEITIRGGGSDELMPHMAWKEGAIVQSVEIRTERESKEESRGRAERMGRPRDESSATVNCAVDDMGTPVILPYERF